MNTPRTLGLGYSSCPNDTFMFHALVHQHVPVPELRFEVSMHDIEALNSRALGEGPGLQLPVTKVSAGVLASLTGPYAILRAGAALGRGVGPLVVARPDGGLRSLEQLAGKRVAVPGLRTTAYLLLEMFGPAGLQPVVMGFDRILASVLAGEADAGLIIHESRFTYQAHGLIALADMGELWERQTGLPLPLGVIVAQRALGEPTLRALERGIADSVRHAREFPADSADYIRAHAQEMSAEVCRQHIDLYVNEYSIDIGEEGTRAIDTLLSRSARARGTTPVDPWVRAR